MQQAQEATAGLLSSIRFVFVIRCKPVPSRRTSHMSPGYPLPSVRGRPNASQSPSGDHAGETAVRRIPDEPARVSAVGLCDVEAAAAQGLDGRERHQRSIGRPCRRAGPIEQRLAWRAPILQQLDRMSSHVDSRQVTARRSVAGELLVREQPSVRRRIEVVLAAVAPTCEAANPVPSLRLTKIALWYLLLSRPKKSVSPSADHSGL